PVVFVAGLLRMLQRSVDGEHWVWYSQGAGQQLFYPPDVSGWDDSRWLDTGTVRGRFDVVSEALSDRYLDGDAVDNYDETETADAAVAAARAWAGDPNLTAETVGVLTAFAANALAAAGGWPPRPARACRRSSRACRCRREPGSPGARSCPVRLGSRCRCTGRRASGRRRSSTGSRRPRRRRPRTTRFS